MRATKFCILAIKTLRSHSCRNISRFVTALKRQYLQLYKGCFDHLRPNCHSTALCQVVRELCSHSSSNNPENISIKMSSYVCSYLKNQHLSLLHGYILLQSALSYKMFEPHLYLLNKLHTTVLATTCLNIKISLFK